MAPEGGKEEGREEQGALLAARLMDRFVDLWNVDNSTELTEQ